jgi:hypothetical protein
MYEMDEKEGLEVEAIAADNQAAYDETNVELTAEETKARQEEALFADADEGEVPEELIELFIECEAKGIDPATLVAPAEKAPAKTTAAKKEAS